MQVVQVVDDEHTEQFDGQIKQVLVVESLKYPFKQVISQLDTLRLYPELQVLQINSFEQYKQFEGQGLQFPPKEIYPD